MRSHVRRPAARRGVGPTQTERRRVRNLIALDAAKVMARLEKRKEEMISLFSKLRDREPMLGTLTSWFDSIAFRQMALLDAREQSAVHGFYEAMEELRWYFRYTEDMPSTAQQVFSQLHRQLDEHHRKLVATIGRPFDESAAPVVEGEVVHRAMRRRR